MGDIIIVAVKAVIVFKGKALIIQRSASDEVGANSWEFAGGKLDFGEDLEAALKREVYEETGLDVDVEKLLYATTFKTSEYRQIVIISYLCIADNNNVMLSDEHQNYFWADKIQLLKMLPEPLINDFNKNNIWHVLDNIC